MYAVVRRYRFDPKNSEEINRRIKEVFVHLVRQSPGFVNYFWLDTGEGEGASLTVFRFGHGPGRRSQLASLLVLWNSIWQRCWEIPKSSKARSKRTQIVVGSQSRTERNETTSFRCTFDSPVRRP